MASNNNFFSQNEFVAEQTGPYVAFVEAYTHDAYENDEYLYTDASGEKVPPNELKEFLESRNELCKTCLHGILAACLQFAGTPSDWFWGFLNCVSTILTPIHRENVPFGGSFEVSDTTWDNIGMLQEFGDAVDEDLTSKFKTACDLVGHGNPTSLVNTHRMFRMSHNLECSLAQVCKHFDNGGSWQELFDSVLIDELRIHYALLKSENEPRAVNHRMANASTTRLRHDLELDDLMQVDEESEPSFEISRAQQDTSSVGRSTNENSHDASDPMSEEVQSSESFFDAEIDNNSYADDSFKDAYIGHYRSYSELPKGKRI